jgi:hypothetical protein
MIAAKMSLSAAPMIRANFDAAKREMEKTWRINRFRRALLIRRRRRFCPTAHFVLRRCQKVSAILAFRSAVESMRIRIERSTTTQMARPVLCASEKAGLRRRIFLATNGTTIRALITG